VGGAVGADLGALLKQHRPLVQRLAWQMLRKLPTTYQIDDLVQAGMIGLHHALQRFDDLQGVQFETFATQRIRGAMLDELRCSDWMSRASRRNWRQAGEAIKRLQHQLGRDPTDGEQAAELGLTLQQFHEAWRMVSGVDVFSLQEMCGPDGSTDQFIDRWAQPVADTAGDQIDARRVDQWIYQAIESLPERERQAWAFHFEDGLTQSSIAASWGVDPARVCQLLKQAERRIVVAVRARAQLDRPAELKPVPEPEFPDPPADVLAFAGVRW